MNSIVKNSAILYEYQYTFLEEAEEMFGAKTEYGYEQIGFYNGHPVTIPSEELRKKGIVGYRIMLCAKGLLNLTDGIFQLSHEVVHLLSPVELRDGNEVNYLEEGMATWFSKLLTERETGNLEFCMPLIEMEPKYLKAYLLYLDLIAVDQFAVKKLRKLCPVIAKIKEADFRTAELEISDSLAKCIFREKWPPHFGPKWPLDCLPGVVENAPGACTNIIIPSNPLSAANQK